MFFELVLRARMGERSPRQIGRALSDGEIHPFNERRVQCRRVLGVGEPCFEPPRRAYPLSSVDLNDAIVSSRLEHLVEENRWTKDATDDLLIEIKSVGGDQGTGRELHARRDVAHERPRVPVAAPPDDGRRPEARPHLNRRKNPRGPRLPTGERADLVGLKLFDDEASTPALAKSTTHGGGSFEPAGDGVPGQPFDPGDRGQANALDSERDDGVERRAPMLETVVGCAVRRRERLSAPDAPISTAFPGSRSVETVADEVPGTDASMDRTCGIGTSAILQFGLALVDERTASLEIGAQTLAHRRVTGRRPTLGCGST